METEKVDSISVNSRIIVKLGLYKGFTGTVISINEQNMICTISLDLWDIGYTFEEKLDSITGLNDETRSKYSTEKLNGNESSRTRKNKNTTFLPNFRIAILEGPLKGLEGRIITVDSIKRRCKVLLDIYEKDFPIDIGFEVLELTENYYEDLFKISSNIELKINSSLIDRIQKPEDIFRISPYQFEELIGEILEIQGFDVKITPKSRDGGRDILSVLKTPIGEILTIVECKQYAQTKKVGIEIAERLLWTCDNKDYASKAMIVTTSSFTKGCYELKEKYLYKLELKDMKSIMEWLCKYGTTHNYYDKSIWNPNRYN
jgi:Transcription antiterminator